MGNNKGCREVSRLTGKLVKTGPEPAACDQNDSNDAGNGIIEANQHLCVFLCLGIFPGTEALAHNSNECRSDRIPREIQKGHEI